eukprot:CFRG1894T1
MPVSPKTRQALSTVRAICFDMDGTLTLPSIDFQRMRELAGVDKGKRILDAVMQFPSPRREAALEAIELVEKEGRENAKLMDGTKDLLEYLQIREVPLAILTRNNKQAVDHFMALLDMKTNPFVMTIDRSFHPCKPHPEPLVHISSKGFNLQPSQCLMVGDHADDVACGRSAGSSTCHVRADQCDDIVDADFSVNSMKHLHETLKLVWEESS